MTALTRVFATVMLLAVILPPVYLGSVMLVAPVAHASSTCDNDATPDVPAIAIQVSDGSDMCFDLPTPREGESFQDAFVAYWGFAPCWHPYVLAEDGSCVNSLTFYGA